MLTQKLENPVKTIGKSSKQVISKHRMHRMHPNSLKNLKPFKPGDNGTKPGQGYSLTAELKHALDKQKRQELVNSTIQGAILREPTPFRELWDRVEGKLQDSQPVGDVNIVFVIGKGYQDAPQLIEGESRLIPQETLKAGR